MLIPFSSSCRWLSICVVRESLGPILCVCVCLGSSTSASALLRAKCREGFDGSSEVEVIDYLNNPEECAPLISGHQYEKQFSRACLFESHSVRQIR